MLIKTINYEHYSDALGKHIRNKKHYFEELKKAGCVPFKEGERLVANAQRRNHKDYRPSEKALDIMRSAKSGADSKGNVKLGDRAIDAMKKLGVRFERHPQAPDGVEEGGFSDASN